MSRDTSPASNTAGYSTPNRRQFIAGTGAASTLLLAGCSSGSGSGSESGQNAMKKGEDKKRHKITIGSAFEPSNVLVRTAEKFKKKVESETDGRISVQVISGGAIGGEKAVVSSVQSGSIDAQIGGGLPVQMFAPKYYFVDTPFIMKNWDHFKRVWNSDAFQPALDKIKKQGNQRNLGVVYRGIRHFTANKPVKKPSDVEGVKLRLPQLTSWLKIWKEIGATPTAVALNELYTALQQGVAEASEGPAQQVHSQSLYEVQSHYSLTSHMVQAGGFYMNEDFFQSLSAADQELVDKAAAEATTWGTKTAKDEESSLIDKLEKNGMTIVRDVDTEAFRQAGMPAVKKLFENEYAASWKDIQNA